MSCWWAEFIQKETSACLNDIKWGILLYVDLISLDDLQNMLNVKLVSGVINREHIWKVHKEFVLAHLSFSLDNLSLDCVPCYSDCYSFIIHKHLPSAGLQRGGWSRSHLTLAPLASSQGWHIATNIHSDGQGPSPSPSRLAGSGSALPHCATWSGISY